MMRHSYMLVLLLVSALIFGGCSGKQRRGPKFGSAPIRAADAEAQRQFDEGVRALEAAAWEQAVERFRLVQSQYPDDPIAVLAELYGARAGLQELAVLEHAETTVDQRALTALAQLAQSKVDDRIRYAAAAYYAAGLASVGNHADAVMGLADYPSSELSPVVLAGDRPALLLLVAEAQAGAGRFDDAVGTYAGLWHLAEDPDVRAFAKSRGFEVAERLNEAQLTEWSGADSDFGRGIAGWTLLNRRVPRASEEEAEALSQMLRRVAPDLLTLGEGARVEPISLALSSRGPARRLAIGVALPLTGPAAQAGREALDGALVAAESYTRNVPTTTLVFVDAATVEPAAGVAKLRAAGVAAILGPLDNARATQWAIAANDAEIPLFSLNTSSLGEAAGSWSFRWFIDAQSEATAVATTAVKEQGDRRIVVLHPNIGYGRRTADWFSKAAIREGGEVVLNEEYDRSATDYGRLAARVAKLAPDAVFIPDTAQKVGEITAFLAQANVWGIDGTRQADPKLRRVQVHYLGTSLWNDAALLRQARSYVAGALIPAWSSEAFKDDVSTAFFASHTASVGRAPRDLAAFAADVVGFVRATFAAGGADPLAVREAASAKTAFRGITGPTRFGPNGEPIRVLRFVSVANGAFVATSRRTTVGLDEGS